ncbi:hypothetical protein ICV35_22575 [Rhodococcus ruber]|uniref:hypothetical protein n=1 Tax=Rhodococcus ruber TaxID=1830 RepID=UPI0017824EE3|nr:hypothetical protein [Rhodococcus ruber]MBD8056441.1 hypothetical protein [Rhodococcus ruber]
MTTSPTTSPARVVDADNRGWFLSFDEDLRRVYLRTWGDAGLDYPTLVAEHGPVRPVVPVPDQDAAAIGELLVRAGRKAVATVAAALELVHHRLRESRGGLEQGTGSNAYAYATLTAGRPGSWESELLPTLVRFGNDLNLAEAPAGDLAQRRARGPHTRVDATVRDELAAVLERWVTAPEQYIEVAENLASLVSRTADEQYGADGWGRIADQWLDPTAPVHNAEAEPLYRLLYSRSAYSS